MLVTRVCEVGERTCSHLVMMVFRFAHRDDAAVGYFAFGVLELDRGVDHAEVVVKDFLHVAQDALAGGGGDVGDGNMAGKRVAF